jgi:glycerol-3-phosphate dehydrogenase
MDQPTAPAGVLGTKGVHLAVPASRVGNRGAVTLLSAVDGRVMFVLPAGTQTIIGTTDTPTTTIPDEVRASLEDVDYLLASVNACFPGAALTRADVITAWAGIRPLIATEDAGALSHAPASAPASASREHAIEQGASGVVTVSGGKLTTYRSMAAETVDLVARALGRPPVASTTHAVPLPGAGGLAGPGAVERAVAAAVAIVGPDRADIAARLVHAYGDRWPIVWALTQGDEALSARLVDGLPYIGAEVVYAVLAESACTLADVLVRRTHVAFETRDAGRAAARMAAALLAPRVAWDADAVARAVAAYDAEAARLFTIDA